MIEVAKVYMRDDIERTRAQRAKIAAEEAEKEARRRNANSNNGGTRTTRTYSKYDEEQLKRKKEEIERRNKEYSEYEAKYANTHKEVPTDPKVAFKTYLNAYKNTILSKITGVAYCKKELMQLIRMHAESHMSPEELKAEHGENENQ